MRRSSAKVAKAPRELRAGSDLVCRSVGVPTTFFSVETDGARYLAKVVMLHATREGYMPRYRHATATLSHTTSPARHAMQRHTAPRHPAPIQATRHCINHHTMTRHIILELCP